MSRVDKAMSVTFSNTIRYNAGVNLHSGKATINFYLKFTQNCVNPPDIS